MKNKYYFDGNFCYIIIDSKIFGRLECKIDKEDFEIVNSIKGSWYAYGDLKRNGIEGIHTKVQKDKIRKCIKIHRLLISCPKNLIVDHIDGNVLNNSKRNLRATTYSINSLNISPISKSYSHYTNIYIERNNKFAVRIKNKRYGIYKTIDEALKVRNMIYSKYYNNIKRINN